MLQLSPEARERENAQICDQKSRWGNEPRARNRRLPKRAPLSPAFAAAPLGFMLSARVRNGRILAGSHGRRRRLEKERRRPMLKYKRWAPAPARQSHWP